MSSPTAGIVSVPAASGEHPGIYVHIPFCRYVCPYCDFNVYAGQQDAIPSYIAAVAEEMRLARAATSTTGTAPTLFIGGGTPSLLSADQIRVIIEAAYEHLNLDADAEVSMEANPDNLNVEYLRDLLGAGINRLSIGTQSLQSAGLKVLGRLHGAAQAERAYSAAREAGFDNISIDFIFGWPGQTLDDWRADLDAIITWEPDHVSLYSLIVEPGTPMATAVRRGSLVPVNDDHVADYFDMAVYRLGEEQWEHYEISNWARDSSKRSIHNQLYWRNARYFGIGAGSHGYLGDRRTNNVRLPAKYIECVRSGSLPIVEEDVISPELALGETMMLGLRLLIDGVSSSDVQARHMVQLDDVYRATIERFVELELLEWEGGRLRLTERGAMVSNSVCAEFLPD